VNQPGLAEIIKANHGGSRKKTIMDFNTFPGAAFPAVASE
jgi:hypothetical protein